MPKPRSSSSKRDREFKKRERDQRKRDKTALKRQRRDDIKSAPTTATTGLVPSTEANAERQDDHDATSSAPEDRESGLDADGGTENCT